jgi:outer membrane protein assembly factor BamD
MIRSISTRFALLLSLVLVAGAIGCGESSQTLANKSSADRFREGMAELEDEDYEEARQLFEVIVLQDPASEFADDAQFYLGESYFRNEDYKLAALHYNRLRTSFPSSPFYKMALFRAAESYDNSSLPYDRDQTDTKYAIDQYDGFMSLYPSDTLVAEARSRKMALRSKLAHKEYSIAEQYASFEDYKAALLYYERVIELYPDTEYFQPATLGKSRALSELDRPDEALKVINHFIDEHPGSTLLSEAQKLKAELGH